ncbi:hypothetical protein AB0O14_19175 [Microbacterium foliorum]|uniref:hypothetical protein n=1 Tax=Rothia terrae TaxID=396015 RepID=UPI003441F312
MFDRLENPLSPSTFRVALAFLGLRYEQVCDDLEIGLKTVEGWTKKSFPSQRARTYVQQWLDRVDADMTDLVNESAAAVEDGAQYVVLETAWSGAGMKQLDSKFNDYPATVHMAMIGRAFAELNARKIPCRVEYIERQDLETRQREPELSFTELEGE